MSSEENATVEAAQQQPLPPYFDPRTAFAHSYLVGDGLEIGPLHLPLATPAHANVRYVDRMTVDDLRSEYPELQDWNLTHPDIIDDGEKLTSVPAGSQDFIVANHFLEHTENPVGTIETHLSKLKPGGVLFYAVPDKRFTFDHSRSVTPLEHMFEDYDRGPERSRSEHYDEWAGLAAGAETATEEWKQNHARELEASKYSIHMHVWTQVEFLALILAIRERFDQAFELEAAARSGIEFIVILRKEGALPAPAPVPAANAEPTVDRLKAGVKRRLSRLRGQARRLRSKRAG